MTEEDEYNSQEQQSQAFLGNNVINDPLEKKWGQKRKQASSSDREKAEQMPVEERPDLANQPNEFGWQPTRQKTSQLCDIRHRRAIRNTMAINSRVELSFVAMDPSRKSVARPNFDQFIPVLRNCRQLFRTAAGTFVREIDELRKPSCDGHDLADNLYVAVISILSNGMKVRTNRVDHELIVLDSAACR